MTTKKPANNAPIYAALYPDLSEIARSHGYALAIHGSLARDFDLVCIPWSEIVSPIARVIDAITDEFALTKIGEIEARLHGRYAVTLAYMGECFLDLSFVLISNSEQADMLAERLKR